MRKCPYLSLDTRSEWAYSVDKGGEKWGQVESSVDNSPPPASGTPSAAVDAPAVV
jgi:hypothetical protein